VLSACVTGFGMIRIRYQDFPAGTHDHPGSRGRAEHNARGVTVYLVPGLTGCQRYAVIRRLRQEASRGCGPALPLPQLAVALGADRVRAVARIAGAIVRLHPVLTLVPSVFVVAIAALFLVVSAREAGAAQGSRLTEAVSCTTHWYGQVPGSPARDCRSPGGMTVRCLQLGRASPNGCSGPSLRR
jgi:hypothetical protein